VAPGRLIGAVTVAAWLVAGTCGAGERSCVDRYVLLRSASPLAHAGDGLVLDTASAVVDPACGAASVRVRRERGRWTIRARWPRCGTTTALRLRLRASRDCTLLRGTLAARGRPPRGILAAVSTCGDGVVDAGRGERCDDGNRVAGDGCDPGCSACTDPATLDGTWAAIRANVFDRHCPGCHGANASGGLDLRGPQAYARLVGVPAAGTALALLAPGERQASLLWLKLAKATLGGLDDLPGAGMPIGPELSADVVEAIGRWIDMGAPATGLVPGTEALLSPCD
jgi:cysteine-rich repeat protein